MCLESNGIKKKAKRNIVCFMAVPVNLLIRKLKDAIDKASQQAVPVNLLIRKLKDAIDKASQQPKKLREFPAEHWFSRWIRIAKKQKSEFIISACDTFDYDDYPIYCKNKKEYDEKYKSHDHDGVNMQTINEIITVAAFKVNKDGSVEEFVKKEKSTNKKK